MPTLPERINARSISKALRRLASKSWVSLGLDRIAFARTFLVYSVLLLFNSCGFVPESVSWNDPRLVPMIKAINAVDRASLGFTPIDPSSKVRLESRPRARYDAMLHIYGPTSRTIAFRKTIGGYKWIHEQEIHTGPNTYTNVDGTFHEQIVIIYGTEPVSGHPPNKLHVEYWGEDPRLPAHRPLTLEQVKPIIAEWNKISDTRPN